jgi:hypothetical protein
MAWFMQDTVTSPAVVPTQQAPELRDQTVVAIGITGIALEVLDAGDFVWDEDSLLRNHPPSTSKLR